MTQREKEQGGKRRIKIKSKEPVVISNLSLMFNLFCFVFANIRERKGGTLPADINSKNPHLNI